MMLDFDGESWFDGRSRIPDHCISIGLPHDSVPTSASDETLGTRALAHEPEKYSERSRHDDITISKSSMHGFPVQS